MSFFSKIADITRDFSHGAHGFLRGLMDGTTKGNSVGSLLGITVGVAIGIATGSLLSTVVLAVTLGAACGVAGGAIWGSLNGSVKEGHKIQQQEKQGCSAQVEPQPQLSPALQVAATVETPSPARSDIHTAQAVAGTSAPASAAPVVPDAAQTALKQQASFEARLAAQREELQTEQLAR